MGWAIAVTRAKTGVEQGYRGAQSFHERSSQASSRTTPAPTFLPFVSLGQTQIANLHNQPVDRFSHEHAINEHALLRLPTTSATEQRLRAPNAATPEYAKAGTRQWHRMGVRAAKQLCWRSCSWRLCGRRGCWSCAGICARTGSKAYAVERVCSGYGRRRIAGADRYEVS